MEENKENYIKWLEGRIKTTREEMQKADEEDKIQLMIVKGAKLTGYKDTLNYIKTH